MPAQRDGSFNRPSIWRRRGILRAAVILLASALVAALISMFDLARQYGYLKTSLLSGPPTGAYYALATRLAERGGAAPAGGSRPAGCVVRRRSKCREL